ncbi:amidohydrolase [Polaribacter sp. HL-MS24]|uniref:amidohydrolase n=1 Tax=Polaribacter sp. HL-MS24 TaxID=3077735 RepID=UPI00293417FC|nr:amidohydrolase [Polaribacter sp. HL-MS24]WOC40825.1 amidohydrolase [Polaribacter sp. HL-MS24]
MMRFILSFSIFISFWCTSCTSSTDSADTILQNAVIWTGNSDQPIAESFAIQGNSILAIGTQDAMEKYKGIHTKIINAQGRFVLPGFIDAHVHLLMGGNSLLNVELRDANTKAIFSDRITSFAKTLQKGSWIVEGNWDHTLWGGELPNKEWIDQGTSDNPVAIYRLDGHMILCNSAALKIAGIDRNTPDVKNGEIVRNLDGTPTGILKSEAMYLVLNKIPALTFRVKKEAIKSAQEYLLSKGVTSIHDVDSLGSFQVLKELYMEQALKIRVYNANPIDQWEEVTKGTSLDTTWYKKGMLKGFVDGSLGSHTAAFKNVYSDKPTDKGIFINSIEGLFDDAVQADAKNLQVTIHAIGDRANESLLDMYERIIQKSTLKDRRFRIEHAQHLDKKDIQRFASLNIIASMQPYHAIDDGRWAEELIGTERIKTTYAFNSLIKAGAVVAFGSDWPVAPASPLFGIYAASTRRTLDHKHPGGWVAKEKITVEEALNAYTKNAAFSSFDEKIKGTLEVGKLADFVLLDANIFKIHPNEIKNVKVIATYVGGKKMYGNE